jgi:signal transduction histidine kinase
LVLYRVIQEAISNIARHARAHRVHIAVLPERNGITIEVSDDGIGFVVGDRQDRSHRPMSLGLLGMQERLAAVGGHMNIDSSPGQGTRVSIFVPRETGGGIS